MRSAQALGVVAFRVVELERASVRNARQSDGEPSLGGPRIAAAAIENAANLVPIDFLAHRLGIEKGFVCQHQIEDPVA